MWLSLYHKIELFGFKFNLFDKYGCQYRDSVLIIVFPKLEVEAGDTINICQWDKIKFQGKVEGGSPPYKSIQWHPTTGLDDATNLTPEYLAKKAGTFRYILRAADSKDYIVEDTLYVIVNSAPDIKIEGKSKICKGEKQKI